MKKLSQQDIQDKIASKPIRLISKYVNTQTKSKWKCTVCQYEWKAVPASIFYAKTLCPNCVGRCQSVKTMTKLANSRGFQFLSNSYSGMKCKYNWKCPDGHTWFATAAHVKNGTGCPYCKSYITEEACRFIFQELTGYAFEKNRSVLETRLELDGYCKELNLAFEYQGKQHYTFIKHLHRRLETYESQKNRDEIKRNLCKKKKINLLEIPYYVNDLEKFIKEKLELLNVKCSKNINWDKFKGKVSMLEELRIAANKLGIESLSSVYINARSRMDFRCKKCGREWQSTSNDIKNGYGCLECGGRRTKTIEEVRERGLCLKLNLLSSSYLNATTKLKWECLVCNNVFMKTPSYVQQRKGCPECGKKKRWETRRLNEKKRQANNKP